MNTTRWVSTRSGFFYPTLTLPKSGEGILKNKINSKNMCNCIEKIEENLTKKMIEKFPNSEEIVDEVRLNPQFIYSESYPLYFKATGKAL
ncbi:MAG: hypothetical protein ACRC0A_07050 [Chitinophagaceae bacterium]